MNSKQFFDAVDQMRQAQKKYFKTRSTGHLADSKRREEIIDDEIARVKKVIERQQNPQLF